MQNKATIVLGGGLKKVGQNEESRYIPEDFVIERLDKALDLFTTNKVDFIVTTGNYSKRIGIDRKVQGPATEAEVSKEYLLKKANGLINSNNLLFENKSFDTIGNAWFAKKLCLEPNQIKSCTIITSDFHMERSLITFKWILGNDYTLDFIEIPTHFEGKNERIKLEKIFTNYVNTWLVNSIKAGDDKAIEKYIYNDHLNYCLSQRGEALFNACLETASITAGY